MSHASTICFPELFDIVNRRTLFRLVGRGPAVYIPPASLAGGQCLAADFGIAASCCRRGNNQFICPDRLSFFILILSSIDLLLSSPKNSMMMRYKLGDSYIFTFTLNHRVGSLLWFFLQ